mgnify:CR=1 FL=1
MTVKYLFLKNTDPTLKTYRRTTRSESMNARLIAEL